MRFELLPFNLRCCCGCLGDYTYTTILSSWACIVDFSLVVQYLGIKADLAYVLALATVPLFMNVKDLFQEMNVSHSPIITCL